MKLYKRLKSQIIWIVFVVISFSSSAFLLNEYSNLDHGRAVSVTAKEAIESDEVQKDDNYESNDLMLLKNLSALILKFLQS